MVERQADSNGYLFKPRTEPSEWVLSWGIREYRYIIIWTQTVGHHHASATQHFMSNWVNCNCQDCNLCPQFVLVLSCFGSLVRFKTRIKVAGGHSVLFQWHGYILRHKTHRKTYWQTDTKQDFQVECVHHTTATHCHQEKHTQPSFYTLSCRILFNFSPPPHP